MVESSCDIFEEGEDLFELHTPWTVQVIRRIHLAFGASSHTFLELLICDFGTSSIKHIAMQIASIAVLLQNEGAGNAWAKVIDLVGLQPDVPILHEVRMCQRSQQLDLYKDLLQPLVVVAYRYALAGKTAEEHIIQNVLDQEDDAFTTATKLTLDNEELAKVVWRKSRLGYAVGGLAWCRRAAYELCSVWWT